MLKQAEGIVIRTRDYGEGHAIVTLFTREQGKMAVVARGVKKTRSRLASLCQPFTHGQFLFFQTSGLPSLSQGEVIQAFQGIGRDLLSTAYAGYITELVDRLTGEREPHPGLFAQYLLSLQAIENGADCQIIARIMEMKLLMAAGYTPQLTHCSKCRAGEHQHFYFDVGAGGITCSDCARRTEQLIPLSSATLRLLRLFQQINLGKLGQVNLKKETRQQLEEVMFRFLDTYAGVVPRSRALIKQLEEMI
jgi:DNA repair protein RecO (recombination protein O)